MNDALSEPRRLHPATLLVRWLKIVPQMLAVGIGVAATRSAGGFDRFLWFAAVMLAVGAVLAFIFWWRFTYAVGAGEIVIQKGLFQRQRRVIPFDRVQDIAIEQRLLARLFGTAKVRIETGGAGKDEGDLDMIALADAHALRDRIRRSERAVEIEEVEEEPLLFGMDLERLLLSGLFGFSLVFFAAIAAFVQQLDQFGLVEWENLVTEERAQAAAGLATLRVALLLGVLILAGGVIAGVARTVARDYGFRLTRAEAGLRRKRGLFTLSEVVIPLRRTQVALIESGPVARWFGWHRLSFQTLGADQKEKGLQVAAPFAKLREIAPILAEAGFPMPPLRAEFQGVPRRALLHHAAPWLVLAALAAAAAFVIEPWAGVGAAALLALAVLVILRLRKHGRALGEGALFVASGLLTRRLWIVPYEKAQTINLARGPVQRRLRLASLLVDTAGASPLRAPEMADLDERDAETLAGELLARFYAARARC